MPTIKPKGQFNKGVKRAHTLWVGLCALRLTGHIWRSTRRMTAPLIIDQSEENLDPKSTVEELVGSFVDAKSKRRVIIVTHNANLVVNADADHSSLHPTETRL